MRGPRDERLGPWPPSLMGDWMRFSRYQYRLGEFSTFSTGVRRVVLVLNGGLGAFSSFLIGSSLCVAGFYVTAFYLRPVTEKRGGTKRNT